jgi:hypothetical protein
MQAPTFGIKDSRSILEQRQSLPIAKLKEQLVQAILDNQVNLLHSTTHNYPAGRMLCILSVFSLST